jgi:Flp pilus assembly protein TadD
VGLLVVALAAALAMLPAFLSARYTDQAVRSWENDLPGAYGKLDDAADLNPLADRPLAAEAVIAEQNGDTQRALGALAEAKRREPEEWTIYFLEARLLAPIDPASSARSLAKARELNPKGTEIDDLERELQGQ